MVVTTAQRVQQIVSEELGVGVDEAMPTASLVDDLGADSLDRINMMMACEEAFGIAIDDPEAERCKTVADVIALITGKVNQQGVTA